MGSKQCVELTSCTLKLSLSPPVSQPVVPAPNSCACSSQSDRHGDLLRQTRSHRPAAPSGAGDVSLRSCIHAQTQAQTQAHAQDNPAGKLDKTYVQACVLGKACVQAYAVTYRLVCWGKLMLSLCL